MHIQDDLTLRNGGEARACAELAESTARLGHEVTIWSIDRGGIVFSPKGVVVLSQSTRFHNRYGLDPRLMLSLRESVLNTDIIHIHGIWRASVIGAAMLANRLRKPYILQPHGSLHPWKLRYKGVRKGLALKLFVHRILLGAAAIHAESANDEEDIRRLVPGAQTVVVPCGAYPDAFAKPAEGPTLKELWPTMANRRCILYLGRLDVNKGIDLLLSAFRELSIQKPEDLGLLIIGPNYNGTWEAVQQQGLLVGIEDRVCYAGMVPDTWKVAALHGCDVYVLPSLSENFGISVLEALLSSAPVVTTTATPWRHLEELGAGIIVEPSANGVGRGITRLLDLSPRERSEMGRRGRDFAIARYDWDLIALEVMGLYERVLSRRCSAI